jgi:dolichol-phosphate mannosyltransferase
MSSPRYSIVVPVFNESESLRELHRRVSQVMNGLGQPWELILVDDGSNDGSNAILQELRKEDSQVVVLTFTRNFGHQIAVTAGLDHVRGEATIIMDADLQDPPEVIPELVTRWQEGYEVVYAVRSEREGETWFKRVTASLFYRMIYRITDVKIPPDSGDFRLLDRKVVIAIRRMREHHRFLRGMASWVGFRQIGVPYQRRPRYAGQTKYPLQKMLRFGLTAVTGFSYFPLQLATYFGFASAGLSLLAIPVVVVLRLTGVRALVGQATTLAVVLFLGGVQLISLGILGEYLGRIYDEVRGRPLYLLREDLDQEQPNSASYFE